MAPAVIARPAKAAHRYRRGQAPKGFQGNNDDDDSASDDEQEIVPEQRRTDGFQIIDTSRPAASRQIKVDVKPDLPARSTVKQESEESSEEESSEEDRKPTYQRPSARSATVKQESSEDETSSEEESEGGQPKPMYKPVFVPKRNRETVVPTASIAISENGEDADEAELRRQAELEKRRQHSSALVGESVKRELAAKDAGEKFPDVDDTDGLDPEAEFEAWKLRELMRLKRDREANYAREKEREEVEARRALPEALRLKEDTEHAAKLRAEKAANRGTSNFLQKYYHKGAFYGDSEILQRYDFQAATGSSGPRDTSSLPEVMQVRNFGKMGRTKYTHLAKEDTSDRNAGWGVGGKNLAGLSGGRARGGADAYASGALAGNGCFNCGGPHRKAECPQLLNAGPSGANAGPVRRRSRSRSPPGRDRNSNDHDDSRRGDKGWQSRDRRDDGDRDNGYGRSRQRSRSRSRSRSPPRRRDDHDEYSKRRRRD